MKPDRADPEWDIIDGCFDGGSGARCGPVRKAPESLFALSNGYLGVRGASEEGAELRGEGGAYVNGFFERAPIAYGESAFGYARYHETIVRLPDPAAFRISIDGLTVGSDGSEESSGRRLDLLRGVLERTLRWRMPDGRVVVMRSERFVSLARPGLASFRLRIRVVGGGSVLVRASLSTRPANRGTADDPRVGSKFGASPYTVETADAMHAVAAATLRTVCSRLSLAVASRCTAELRTAPGRSSVLRATGLADPARDEPFPTLATDVQAVLADGDELVVVRHVSYRRDPRCGAAFVESADGSATADLAAALDDVAEAETRGFDVLLGEHALELATFWERAAIDLDAEPGLLSAIRFNMFHVYQAAGRDGITNVPAKGLTGEGYEGHCFWDTEAYLLPMLGYTVPRVARALLDHRAAILDKARVRARELGHASGALFPWRTISGYETSAYFPAGTAQYHIDADIAYAVVRYVKAAGDEDFLYGGGADILVETARLWLDVGHYGADGQFRIDEVTGPDEYSALVNNNAYTNLMARYNLRAAAALVERMIGESATAFARARDRLGLLPEEPAAWLRAAEAMRVPLDAATGVIAQDDSFMDREPWDFDGTPAEQYPLLLHFHPLAIYRKRVLKQPDLLLAESLLGSEFPLAQLKRDFAFYEPLTTGDSSLSPCAMSVAAARAGHLDRAWEYFQKTVRMDLDDLHGNAEHGVHIAAMGGSWSSLVYGFAGFQDDSDGYRLAPRLPDPIRRLAFSLSLRGGTLDVALDRTEAEYRWRGGGTLRLLHGHQHLELGAGQMVRVDLRPRCRAVIFDLDGVIADTARLHERAWRRLAAERNLTLDDRVLELVKGRSRMESLELVLGPAAATLSAEQRQELAERKNRYYVESLSGLKPDDALPGAIRLLAALKHRGIGIGLASASRNAPEVLARLGLDTMFDAVGNPATARPKPDPELFLSVADALGVDRNECVGIEDAQAGIDAIRRADMKAVGVGTSFTAAHLVVPGLDRLTPEGLEALFHD